MDNLKRDIRTNMVINTDKSSYENYMHGKKIHMTNLQLTQEVNQLKSDVGEIKDLLKQLLYKY